MTPDTSPRQFTPADIKRFRSNLKDEVDGAALYRLLEAAESDPHLKTLYGKLAINEDKHLDLWQAKLREAGAPVPDYKPSMRVRFIGWLARRFGTEAVSPIVTRMENAAVSMYDTQPEAVEHNLPADERSHARLFREIGRKSNVQTGSQIQIARLEGRHRSASGNALRAAVLGVNDGLVSTLSLVTGVAGADPGRDVVFLTGVAGLLAGSIAMALGEWLSVRSSAESLERQLAAEKEELELFPEEEMEELALIYQAKGFSEVEARHAAQRIIADPGTALDTLAREELGMAPGDVSSAWVAAVTSFFLFAGGAILPVLPWLFVGGSTAVLLSAIAAGFGLFASGAVTSVFTGRSLIYSGTRMLIFGLVAAGITFGIGRLIGVNVS